MTAVDLDTRRSKRVEPQAPTSSLWEAFGKAQSEFAVIAKSATGARATQKYAPLDCVLEIVRPILNANHIALTQVPSIEGDTLLIRTVLVHTPTGETHECAYPAGVLTLQHQQLGAGVTYARRYSLLSILGVFPADEDDDGEKAGPAGGERRPATPPPRQQPISRDQLAELQALVDETETDIEAFCRYLKVGALADLSAPAEFQRAKSALETKQRQRAAAGAAQ